MRLFDYENKRVITESDSTKAEELISAGKAVKLELPELDEYTQKADDIYENYKKEVERIKESDNPLMTDEVKAYEIDKLDKQMREQSAEVEEEYIAWKQAQIDEAKARAARAVVKVSDNEKQIAEQFAVRAGLRLANAFDDEKGAVIQQIINDIRLLTDEERTALQAQASQLLADIDDVGEKRKLISAMQEVRNSDLLAVNVAKQLPHSVLTKQRVHDIAKRVAGESMHATGGIDREFYEKYLKEGTDK